MLLFRCLYLLFFFFCFVNAFPNRRNAIASKKSTHINKRSVQQSSSNSALVLTSKLTASNGESFNYFGGENAVVTSVSNNCIVVGADGYNDGRGAAYLFMDPNGPELGRSFSQMAILIARDSEGGDNFGSSVDIDGDIIVVGAKQSVFNGPGAVHVFRILNNNNISQMAKITAQNGVTDDQFGYSVAVRGKFILVGAPYVDVNGSSNVGSAYLFVNKSNDPNNPEWTQIMQFQPDDLTEDAWFGNTVALDYQIAVVGTADYYANVFVFLPVDENVDSLSLWTQMAALTGPTSSAFGNSIAVAGNTIVVGAPPADHANGNEAGVVFVFTKMDDTTSASSSSTWMGMTKLLATNGAADDNFGTSVSISRDASTIVVGADYDDYSSTVTNSGAAYLFRNLITTTMTGWTQVSKYVAADPDVNDYLGISIAMENSIVVVGASGDDTASGTDAGSLYILDTENSSPTPNGTSTKSHNSNIIIAAMIVVGAVVAVLGIAIAFFNYCRKREDGRLPLEQQQLNQQTISPPLPPLPFGDNRMAVIMADVVVLPSTQPTEDRTLEADVLLDPLPTHAAAAATKGVTDNDKLDVEKELPDYKDQIQNTDPPAEPSCIPSSFQPKVWSKEPQSSTTPRQS